eukprot:18268-Heterococcus_DN1.PRE.1
MQAFGRRASQWLWSWTRELWWAGQGLHHRGGSERDYVVTAGRVKGGERDEACWSVGDKAKLAARSAKDYSEGDRGQVWTSCSSVGAAWTQGPRASAGPNVLGVFDQLVDYLTSLLDVSGRGSWGAVTRRPVRTTRRSRGSAAAVSTSSAGGAAGELCERRLAIAEDKRPVDSKGLETTAGV